MAMAMAMAMAIAHSLVLFYLKFKTLNWSEKANGEKTKLGSWSKPD